MLRCLFVFSLLFALASAQVLTYGGDLGWYPNEGSILTKSGVSDSNKFGQLFQTKISGNIIGQPLANDGKIYVVTSSAFVHALDAATGNFIWSRSLGTPFDAFSEFLCSDFGGSTGILSTPVIDNSTGILYVVAKVYTGAASLFAPRPVSIRMYGVNGTTGDIMSGFPLDLKGSASNNFAISFVPRDHSQWPGLVLVNGVVYAAFGSHCDKSAYRGWVIGVNVATPTVTTLWTSEALSTDSGGGGFGMSGSAILAMDSPMSLVLVSSPGAVPIFPVSPALDVLPPARLGNAVIRLKIESSGALTAMDYFISTISPDLGPAGALVLPATCSARHIIAGGQSGNLYVLDPNNLGGYSLGLNGTNNNFATYGPYGPSYSRPSVFPSFSGCYIYHITSRSPLLCLQQVTSGAVVSYQVKAQWQSTGSQGSSSPIITSDGTALSSGIVWVLTIFDGLLGGYGAFLQALDATPQAFAQLALLRSFTLTQAQRYNPPIAAYGRIYVVAIDSASGNAALTAFGMYATPSPPPSPSTVNTPTRNPSSTSPPGPIPTALPPEITPEATPTDDTPLQISQVSSGGKGISRDALIVAIVVPFIALSVFGLTTFVYWKKHVTARNASRILAAERALTMFRSISP